MTNLRYNFNPFNTTLSNISEAEIDHIYFRERDKISADKEERLRSLFSPQSALHSTIMIDKVKAIVEEKSQEITRQDIAKILSYPDVHRDATNQRLEYFKQLGINIFAGLEKENIDICWEIFSQASRLNPFGIRTTAYRLCRNYREEAKAHPDNEKYQNWHMHYVNSLLSWLNDYWSKNKLVGDSRTVITLCGSSRFQREFTEVATRLTMQGHVVLSLPIFGHALGIQWNDEQKAALDESHKERIALSENIVVIDKDGIIGESTRNEIRDAEALGTGILYMSELFPDINEGNYLYVKE